MKMKINGIELFCVSLSYKTEKNVQVYYTGNGNYIAEFFDNDLYQSKVTFTAVFTIQKTEYKNSEIEFEKNEIVNIEWEDFIGTAVITDYSMDIESSDVNFRRPSISFHKITQIFNTPDYTPRQDVKKSKSLTEKLLGEEFARRLSKAGKTVSSSYKKVNDTANNIQLNILNSLNGINSFSNGVDNANQGITGIFQTSQTVINTLQYATTALANLKTNISNLLQEPSAFYSSLQNVFDNFKNVFADDKYTIDVLAGLSSVEYAKPLPTSSLNEIDFNNISTLENANRILCLTNIYDLLPTIVFDNKTELNNALERIKALHKKVKTQDATIMNYLNELSRNAILLAKERNKSIPSLQEIVATNENIDNLIVKYNGDDIDYETFQKFKNFVIKTNRLKNLFNINQTILMPVLAR